MFKKIWSITLRSSLYALFGAANGKYVRGRLSEACRLSIEGLGRSKIKRNARMWSDFFDLAVEIGLKLKDKEIFSELSAIAIAEDSPDYLQDVSKSLLDLSMWGYGLELNDLSSELVEKSIKANSENAEAWFFSGWLMLDKSVQEASKRLQRSVELDPSMTSRIGKDARCKKFLSPDIDL